VGAVSYVSQQYFCFRVVQQTVSKEKASFSKMKSLTGLAYVFKESMWKRRRKNSAKASN
jgi:hypothetical protein